MKEPNPRPQSRADVYSPAPVNDTSQRPASRLDSDLGAAAAVAADCSPRPPSGLSEKEEEGTNQLEPSFSRWEFVRPMYSVCM